MTRERSWVTTAAALVVVSLVATGCGGTETVTVNDRGISTTSAAAPQGAGDNVAIREVADRYVEQFRKRDWDGLCETFAPAARVKIAVAGAIVTGKESPTCPDVMEATLKDIPSDAFSIELVDIKITGTTATATNNGKKIDEEDDQVVFQKVGGKWFVATEDQAEDGEALRARVKQWPAAWCGLKPGASRASIRAALGKPTTDLADQDQWSGFGLALTAFYDADLRAIQLQVGEGKVPCAYVRR